MTPARSSAGSKPSKPRTTAAALRADAQASTTTTAGAPSPVATAAVEPAALLPSMPSKHRITPSTTARCASWDWRATQARTASRPHIQPSRLCDGRPVASAWKPGSMKSDPTLNAWIRRPRRRSASRSPSVIEVLPTPVATPAITSIRAMSGLVADAGRLERRHLAPDARGGTRQVDEERGARPLAEAQREVEVGREPEVLEHHGVAGLGRAVRGEERVARVGGERHRDERGGARDKAVEDHGDAAGGAGEDRKSTRLNSSHSQISYAVFCLKKKKKEQQIQS